MPLYSQRVRRDLFKLDHFILFTVPSASSSRLYSLIRSFLRQSRFSSRLWKRRAPIEGSYSTPSPSFFLFKKENSLGLQDKYKVNSNRQAK